MSRGYTCDLQRVCRSRRLVQSCGTGEGMVMCVLACSLSNNWLMTSGSHACKHNHAYYEFADFNFACYNFAYV